METLFPGAQNIPSAQNATIGLDVNGINYDCGPITGSLPATCIVNEKGNVQLSCQVGPIQQGSQNEQLLCTYPFSGKLTANPAANNYTFQTTADWPPFQGAGIAVRKGTSITNYSCQKTGNETTCSPIGGFNGGNWNCIEQQDGNIACDIGVNYNGQIVNNNLVINNASQATSFQENDENNNLWIWILLVFLFAIFLIYLWNKNNY